MGQQEASSHLARMQDGYKNIAISMGSISFDECYRREPTQ